MTEYCTVSFPSWQPNGDPNSIVEYVFDKEEQERLHRIDHLFSPGTKRLQVTKEHSRSSEDNDHCIVTLQCKQPHDVAITGFAVASEARTVEMYDNKNGSYLQTVRGVKDKEDSEADNSKIHFLCRYNLQEPLSSLKLKFLSLGQRESFEIAYIKLSMSSCISQPGQSEQSVNMEKLRQDIDSMGDTVSERARSFLSTLENFQKSKRAVEDVRHLLLDLNLPGGETDMIKNIITLLSTYTAVPGRSSNPYPLDTNSHFRTDVRAEGSIVNNVLLQMMSSFAIHQKAGVTELRPDGDSGDMYKFLQSMCDQVGQLRAAEQKQAEGDQENEEEKDSSRGGSGYSDAELKSRVEALVESRLTAVEEHIKQEMDQRIEEMETRMSNKLDAIFALLQNSQKHT